MRRRRGNAKGSSSNSGRSMGAAIAQVLSTPACSSWRSGIHHVPHNGVDARSAMLARVCVIPVTSVLYVSTHATACADSLSGCDAGKHPFRWGASDSLWCRRYDRGNVFPMSDVDEWLELQGPGEYAESSAGHAVDFRALATHAGNGSSPRCRARLESPCDDGRRSKLVMATAAVEAVLGERQAALR